MHPLSPYHLVEDKSNALLFLPDPSRPIKEGLAVFCHGYTAHKGDLLTWASRLSEEGLTTLIFDIPGHYLGSYNEVESFEEFKNFAGILSFNSTR